MRNRLVILMISLFVFGCGTLFAQYSLSQQDFPAAAIDNLFIPHVNPSLLGTSSGDGLSIVHHLDKEKFQKHYWLIFNSGGFSYSYERDNSENYHQFGIGSEALDAHILPNLYMGVNYRNNQRNFKDGVFRSALTYRPHNSTSVAFTLDNPVNAAPGYHGGIAIRPFAFNKNIDDYRLELSADLDYRKNKDGDYKVNNFLLGVNTQVFDGIKIGGTYNFDEKAALLSIGMAFGKTQTGGLARLSDEDNHGYLYAHLSSLAYKPLLGMSPKSWYKMPAKATVVSYRAPKYELGPINLFDKNVRTIDSMKKELKRAKNDSTIDGILLVNPSYGTSFALMQELIEAFRDFKESGKHISVYYDNISNGGYIFSASIADKIYLNPTGMLDLRGIAIASPYLRDLLDSVGVEPINLRSHKYKNAGNMFSESEMTEAEREVYESLLDSIYEQVLASIETGRGDRLIKPIAELVDEGPYVIAQEALDAGLVDKLIYQDELKGELKKDFSFSKERKEMANYHNYEWAKPKENLIAVIYASGNIVMGKGKAGQKIAHQTTVDLIRKARKDPKYKGIILRVDSGGGSAQASDIILRELELAKKENNMPIVVSMAGSAASGGYYIAANADKIVADGTTLTGSIGVIGLAFNASELFKKVKVNWSTVKKGEHADLGALHRPMRDSEKNILESMIEHTYDDFIGIVADGRGMSKDEVHEIAQGRVWTGAQAKDIGLVDALGSMDEAVAQMREVAGIKGEIRLVDATSSGKGLDITISGGKLLNMAVPQSLQNISEEYIKLYEMWQDFEGENAFYLSPVIAEENNM